MIRAAIFDYFGTLTVSPTVPDHLAARKHLAETLGLDPDAFRAEMRATYTERATGRAGRDVVRSLRWLAGRLGAAPSDEQLRRAARLRLGETASTPLRPDAVAVLRELRARGVRVGMVSDCAAELPVIWPGLPVAPYVEVPLFSVVEGRRKPDRALYRTVCNRLGVSPRECLYVGDGGSDELSGARAAGMWAVRLLTPDHQAELVYGLDTTWDGPVITRLGQVLDLVGTGRAQPVLATTNSASDSSASRAGTGGSEESMARAREA